MADMNIILSGFLGGFFGSVTSLLGVYLTHRAQGKREDKQFIRSQLLQRLERQRSAESIIQSQMANIIGNDEASEALATAFEPLEAAFGEHLTEDIVNALFELQDKDHPHGPQYLLLRHMAISSAMSTMIRRTEALLGLPDYGGEGVYQNALVELELQYSRPSSPTPSRVTGKDESGSSGKQHNQDDDATSRVEAVQGGKK